MNVNSCFIAAVLVPIGCAGAGCGADGSGDGCPDDPDKDAPGVCGCGVPDTDSDLDGALDCQESCPGDPDKTEPGICGCGNSDTDADGDGLADCVDPCPHDAGLEPPGGYVGELLSDLAAAPDLHDQKTVVVLGTVKTDVAAVTCTDLECPPEDPCCNECAARLVIEDGDAGVGLRAGEVSPVGCSGTNCDYLDNCQPFAPDQDIRLWGTFTADPPAIEVDGYCVP